MSHFSDDFNDDDFMNASAEQWSKPSTPETRPPAQPEPTDRWGSPIADRGASPGRWGSEPTQTPGSGTGKNGGSKWWIILIVILVVLCLCACLVMFGLPLVGITLL